RSGLREQLGIHVSQRPYNQSALIANITPSEAHCGQAFERFTDDGPMALLPLPENRCALVWTRAGMDARRLAEIDERAFLAELQGVFGYRLGTLRQVGARHLYPLSLVEAQEQVRSHLVVLGNAAHSLHPIAGQGFNLSLRDVQSLADGLLAGPEAPFEPRVSALSMASQRILERVGAWQHIRERRLSPYSDMHVWDGSGTGQIHFSAASVHAEVLGHIVENRVVQDGLLQRLHDSEIGLLANARLEQMRRSGDDWLLTLADGRTLRAPLVIAADGANSAVRRLTGCQTREWDYLHHAIVTSVRCAEPHQATAWQRFTDDGPLAFLPLLRDGQQHWCSIVWSTTPAQAERLMALPDEAFCAELERAFEGRLGTVLAADPRLCVPLRQRHAKRYVAEGLALIGDAAQI
uniref:2-octaprenyl-6-methoxyphenyl hydroxylase n=1 Tax=Steinernema glaseri TaxID=37863 RepID=A0A1I8AKQ0_9BILA